MKLDDFESVFRSAVKDTFEFRAPQLSSGLLLTDMSDRDAAALTEKVAQFFQHAHGGGMTWDHLGRGALENVPEAVAMVESRNPDFIACYRHLLGRNKQLVHSLGSTVDTLSQTVSVPMLLIPNPDDIDNALAPPTRVLVIADHLTGNHELVNWGVHLCPEAGTLYLAHVEDAATFARYIDVIGRIQGLDTELATRRIHDKLLSMPADYIETIKDILVREGIQEQIVPLVSMGHALTDYKRIISDHDIELVVLDTKDDRQLAMHGMAHALAVEVRHVPLLLL